jgi:membrane fusion protein (multidrug efflux system)
MIKKLISLLLLVVTLFGAWRWFAGQTVQPDATPTPGPALMMMALPVKAAQAKNEAIAAKIEAVGDVQAGESVVLRPEITGRIASIRFEEGHKVKAGDVLVELNSEEQRAALAQSQASVQVQQQGFQRIREVKVRNLVSQQQYDEALAQLQNAQALLEGDKFRLSRTVLHAPFDGIIGLRQVSIGDYVSPGQALVNLESLDPIKLDFRLPEKYASKVVKGLRVEVTVEAWPNRVFTGEILAVDPKLDEATRTLKARAKLTNADLALKPGMFARVLLSLGAARPALFVPEQAIEVKGSKTTLYRIVDGKVVLTTVKTGDRHPGSVEIIDGVAAGEWVVTDGQLKLHDGMPVTIINKAAP